jgi:hypothetical protein
MDRLLGISFEFHRFAALFAQRSFRLRAEIALSQALFKKIAKEGPALLSQLRFHLVVRRLWMVTIPAVEIFPQILGLLQKLISRLPWRLPGASTLLTHGLPPLGTVVC